MSNNYIESINEVTNKKRYFELDLEPIFEQILLNMVLS